MEVVTLMPPIGTELWCYFGANRYRAKVIAHGSKYPKVRFKLKNGKVKEGPATVIPPGPTGVTYSGYLAQMFGYPATV